MLFKQVILKAHTNNELLLQALKESNDFEEPDQDDLFWQSVGKQLKKLNEYQKSLAKINIQQVIHEVKWLSESQL